MALVESSHPYIGRTTTGYAVRPLARTIPGFATTPGLFASYQRPLFSKSPLAAGRVSPPLGADLVKRKSNYSVNVYRPYLPFIASITWANRESGTLANDMPEPVCSVVNFPVNSWMCLLDHSPGARFHNAKIMAVGFGAAFLWTTFFLTSTIFPFLSNADSVVVSSHS